MTTPQNTSSDLHADLNKDLLVERLKALPQAEPSPELDAAILSKIEQALKQEAQQQKIEGLATQASKREVHPSRQNFFDGLQQKLKQFWFIPVGAMAMLLASVTLNNSGTISQEVATSLPAKEMTQLPNTPEQAADTADRSIQTSRTEIKDQAIVASNEAKQTPMHRETQARTAIDSKKMAADLARLIEKNSKERLAAKEDAKEESANELAQLSKSKESFAKRSEKMDVAIQAADRRISDNSPPMEAMPKPVITQTEQASNTSPGAAELKVNSARIVADATLQRVEVTGSSIKRVTAENSNAVQARNEKQNTDDRTPPKTELYAVKDVYEPNLRQSQAEQTLGKAMQRDTVAMAAAPRPEMSLAKAAPPAPVAPPAPIAPIRFSAPTTPSEVIKQQTDTISDRLTQLINAGRTSEAIQLWKDFHENFPQTKLAPELQKKLEELERKQKPKKSK